MARNRMIKPEFWEDDKIAECSPIARLLFIALWNFADDEGFVEYRPKWLKTKCLPYDNVKIEDLINELLKFERIRIQNDIIYIPTFLKHQKIDKPRPSNLKQIFKISTNSKRSVDDISATKREREYEIETEREREENGDKSPTPKQTMQDFIQIVTEKGEVFENLCSTIAISKGIEIEIVRGQLDEFIEHWTERTPSGKRQKWELQKTFEVQRRLGTWFSNAEKWGKLTNSSSIPSI